MKYRDDELTPVGRAVYRSRNTGKYYTRVTHPDGNRPFVQHPTLKAAKKYRDDIESERKHLGRVRGTGSARRLTISQLVERFLSMKQRTKPKSVKSYRERLDKLLRFSELKRVRYVDQFTPFHADDLLAYLMSPECVRSAKIPQGQSLCNRTVNLHVSTIREAFKYAMGLHVIDRNPLDIIPLLDVAKPKPKAFTDAELQAFFAAPMPEEYRRVFSALSFSGLRISELCALRWHHIDFRSPDKPVLYVPGTKTEGSARTIALEPEMIDLLREVIANPLSKDYPFCNTKGGELNRNRVLKACKRIGKAAGLTDSVHTHRFRHTLASKCLEKGYPLIKIMRILGQTSPETTARYCRRILLGQHDIETAEKMMNALIEGVMY